MLLLVVLLSDDLELSIAVWLTGTEDVMLEISMGGFPVTATDVAAAQPNGP
ncbi:hypothetical protein [Bradyrhizobium sp. Tv2a-2]|uniref:hypothetical protein n=1 Tax=Bradyrhizobium sp. Tv2a-2 TaxID=113395 RepID=UPI0018DB6945|nr:hypothetical protein [Bradyrhizobium sp. Tv2a-2]